MTQLANLSVGVDYVSEHRVHSYPMAATSFGPRLRELREQRGDSLRKFAQTLDIAPAHLVDLEKNRRSPSPELLQRIADELDQPVSVFDPLSFTLPKAVQTWIHQNPCLGRALALVSKFDDPQEAISLLERTAPSGQQRRFPMAIYESELQAIGQESTSWDSETGGDLFGVWGDIPIVYLATKSGPNSVRDHAHFRLDVDYLIALSIQLERDWGLRYFGDWHSHHRLGLSGPSGGDITRIQRLGAKNGYHEMAEFIITFPPRYNAHPAVHVHPYAYLDLPSDQITDVVPIVLSGISPVRDALIQNRLLPEQQLTAHTACPLARLSIPYEPLPRVDGRSGPVADPISNRAIKRATAELETITSSPVEIHDTAFGFILVCPVTDAHHVAVAIDRTWPHAILQADWMDRENGRSDELSVDLSSAVALDSAQLKRVFLDAKRSKGYEV